MKIRERQRIMKIPSPRSKLANCMWLPRILVKARLVVSGELPDSYAAFFCHSKGVDGQFMSFFSLDREQIISVAELNDQDVKDWFLSLSQVSLKRIEEWNHMAENFGRNGFPMQEQLKNGLMSSYSHLAHLNLDTVFDVLEADDEITYHFLE